jgi:hypothetical protein
MNISNLVPPPSHSEPFKRTSERFVPDKPGCYVLATFLGEVIYLGLAENLRRRLNEHLDSPQKTGLTDRGRAVLFHWFETTDTNKVERTWLNIHLQLEGVLPPLNKMYSPTST